MKKKGVCLLLALLLLGLCAPLIYSQETDQKPVIRSLRVEWYVHTRQGVKIKYINFNGTPKLLYLPRSFENKFYRFVVAPKETGFQLGLPALIIHMRGQKVIFIDIYIEHEERKRIASGMSEKDLEMLQAAEQKGEIELGF